jgi:hypothetical protein
MTTTNEKTAKGGVDRRTFFRAGSGAAIVAAATVAGSQPASASESQNDRVKARYRETDHVKAFYRVNRY